jgi:hypothetical protein
MQQEEGGTYSGAGKDAPDSQSKKTQLAPDVDDNFENRADARNLA